MVRSMPDLRCGITRRYPEQAYAWRFLYRLEPPYCPNPRIYATVCVYDAAPTWTRRCGLLQYSFVADRQLHICNRAELRDYIINPPDPPFVMVCAVSQKKHLAIKSVISYRRDNFFCMYEEEPIFVDRATAEDDIRFCEALRGIGCTKEEIEKGIIRYDKIKNYGIKAAEKLEAEFKRRLRPRQFALCLHVAQKMNEEEAICYLGLTRKTNT